MLFSCVARSIDTFLLVFLLAIPVTDVALPLEVKNQVLTQSIVAVNEESGTSSIWELYIPKINLRAEIAEGTDDKIMNQYIGHFSETPDFIGNIGLAAHNRGYPVNYFKDLKKLEIGDKINYKYQNKQKEYIVDKIKIIKDTNWEMLQNTKENRLTLITCIENEPEYRLCVQAIEIGGYNEI